ncbi:hypothetical protein HK098_006518 [Nowakowskiella sp. JEL0407]|nr:hypothetical protein HK098_006518 [Nowakowskiella sp. JEL0407]
MGRKRELKCALPTEEEALENFSGDLKRMKVCSGKQVRHRKEEIASTFEKRYNFTFSNSTYRKFEVHLCRPTRITEDFMKRQPDEFFELASPITEKLSRAELKKNYILVDEGSDDNRIIGMKLYRAFSRNEIKILENGVRWQYKQIGEGKRGGWLGWFQRTMAHIKSNFNRGPYFSKHFGMYKKTNPCPMLIAKTELYKDLYLQFLERTKPFWDYLTKVIELKFPDVYRYLMKVRETLERLHPELLQYCAGLFPSVAINIGAEGYSVCTVPHRDFDSLNGICCVLPFGDFVRGGELNLAENGIKLENGAGDILLFDSKQVHFNSEVTGVRSSITLFIDSAFDKWIRDNAQ